MGKGIVNNVSIFLALGALFIIMCTDDYGWIPCTYPKGPHCYWVAGCHSKAEYIYVICTSE